MENGFYLLGWLFPAMFLIGGLLALAGTAFWVWMLIDCAMNEPDGGSDKLVWILIIALTHWLGALLYLILQRPKRRRQVNL